MIAERNEGELIWFVLVIWFIWLVSFNQTNETH